MPTNRADRDAQMELRHRGREVKTALELAIVAMCPQELVERLASTVGLLEAVAELPLDNPSVAAWASGLDQRANKALKAWSTWRAKHLAKISA